jgi:hypothetical protein
MENKLHMQQIMFILLCLKLKILESDEERMCIFRFKRIVSFKKSVITFQNICINAPKIDKEQFLFFDK